MKKCNIDMTSFILIFILAIGVFSSIPPLFNRMQVEQRNKQVNIVLDYDEIELLAEQSEKDIEWWFENFAKLGVKYVALREDSIASLIRDRKPMDVVILGTIVGNMALRERYPNKLVEYAQNNLEKKYDYVLLTKEKNVFDIIYEGIKQRYPSKNPHIIQEDGYFVIILGGTKEDLVNAYSSKLINLRIGLNKERIEKIQRSGLQVLARPYSYPDWNDEQYISSILKDYKKYNIKLDTIIFDGAEILGHSDESNGELFKKYLQDNNIKIGMIENYVQRGHILQDGLEDLARDSDYNAIRVFSMWIDVQRKFAQYNYQGAEEIENDLYRAVTERNIRMIYFKPFIKEGFDYVIDFEEYEQMFKRFERRLAKHGMSIGESSTMEPVRVRVRWHILMGWAVIAAGIILISFLFRIKNQVKLSFLFIGMLMVLVLFMKNISLGESVLSLGIAIIAPSLAMVYFCYCCKTYGKNSLNHSKKLSTILYIVVKDLLILFGISLIGGMLIAAMLSDIEYLLEMRIFRGVKISQLAPIVIYTFLYLAFFGYGRKKPKERSALEWQDFKNILGENIKVAHLLIVAAIGYIGYIYIARTGHETTVNPLQIEILFRNMLEEHLIARPRNKEFLLAFPAVIAGIYLAIKGNLKLTFLIGLGAIIGQTSIVNTFCHLRTPVYISLFRSLYSLLFGILVALIYLGIVKIGYKGFVKIKKLI